MNIKLSTTLIQKLVSLGVQDFIVCAGARNAPLVKVLGAVGNLATPYLPGDLNLTIASSPAIKINYFFDERAAGFFALGRARRDTRPVAIVTTSGTAVAELLPSAVEAYYSGIPLVFVTADRPTSYRGSGAPQAIEQVGIFSHYASQTFDLSKAAEVSQVKISSHAATHINVCFAEPLIDAMDVNFTTDPCTENRADTFAAINNTVSSEQASHFFTHVSRPLVIVSELTDSVRSAVFEALHLMQAPMYAEAQSNLRNTPDLASISLRSGSSFLNATDFRENFDSVIRFGSVPTLRLWRDLEDKLHDVPVLSVSDLPFSGLARQSSRPLSFSNFLNEFKNLFKKIKFNHAEDTIAKDRIKQKKIETALSNLPQAEASWFRVLSDVIPQGSLIMLGNSLPIREWDMAANYKTNDHKIFANRGANGIDGLLSTFLGLAQSGKENWLILGDLSALYDLNALSMLHAIPSDASLRIVVINNRGGQIFKPMFKDKNFLNEHNFEFKKWAEMFDLKYIKFTKASDRKRFKLLTPENFIIEIQPDALQSDEFWEHI